MIKGKEMKCVEQHLYCERCGTEMERTGQVLLSCPPKYPHICPKCGYKETHLKGYPCTEFVNIKEETKCQTQKSM